jgi:hypothetical protein
MVYVPNATADGNYWTWYVAFAAGAPWRLTRHRGISPSEIARLEARNDRKAPA